MIDERFVLFVRDVRLHDRVEELGVFLANEEIQFVRSEFRVQRSFLFNLQFRPRQDERKLGHFGICQQRRIERVDFGQAVVILETAPCDILQRERLTGGEHRHLLLLREVLRRVEAR